MSHRWSGSWKRLEISEATRLEEKAAAFDELRAAASDVLRVDWPGGDLHAFAMDRLRSVLIQLDKTFGVKK